MSDHFGNIPIESPKPSQPAKEKKPAPPPASAKPAKEKSRQRMKMNRLWLWAAGIALVAGLYTAFGFLGIPFYIGKALPVNFREATGMTLEPGQVSFNPFTFRFTTRDAQILSEAGPAVLSLKSLTADLAPLSLLRRDLVSNAINIEELDLTITRELDGSYNFDQLIRRKKTSNASEIMDFSDLPFFFSLNNIAIKNGKVLFNDLPAGKTHTITDIQLDLPAFSNIPFRADQYIHPRFSAVINGTPVELTGQAHLGKPGEPNLTTNLSCDLHGLDLPAYSEYLPVDLPLVFKKGKADGKLDFHFNPEASEDDKLTVGFDLKIADTELQTPDESILIVSSSAQLSGTLQPVAKTLHFTTIAFAEPGVHSYGESFFKNINSLMKRERKASATDAAPASPFVVATDALDFENGSFRHYRKQQDQKPEFTWKTLEMHVKDYSSVAKGDEGKDFGSFRLSGEKEDGAASFSWQGVFTSPENLKGTLKLAKMDFPELLQALGTENKEFAVQGTADLKGELAFPSAADSAAKVGYKLSDGELAVQNFKLLENKQAVLSAPVLQVTGLSTAGKVIDWGKITLHNGVGVFPASHAPGFFKHFNSDKNRIQELDLDGQVTLVPEKKGKPKIHFSNFSIKAGNLETPEKAKNNFTLSAQTPTGGTMSSQGDLRLAPFALAAKTEFGGLAAEDIFPLFSDAKILNSLSGALSGNGTLSFPQQSFAGDLRIAKGQVQKAAKTLYSWEDSVFQGVNYTSAPLHLGIALAAFDQLEYTWQINPKDDDPMQQFAAFFQQHLPSEKQSGDKNKDSISAVDIQEIRLAGGRFRIQDNRMKPKWQGQVTEFSGSIKEIHLPTTANAGDFSFTGKLDEVPLFVEGSLDVFAKTQPGKFRLKLEGYPLSAFHKQLSAKTDIDTKEGEFSLTLDAMWQDGQYSNAGSLLFSGVKPVSEKADSALPLALLTGPENIFQLDFDLQRSTPVAKTTLAEEIISTWETKTVKAAVSPLLLASGDFSDLIGNEFTEFLPGEFMLSDKGRETLTRYSTLLLSHPYLGLSLSGGVDKQQDGEAIKKQLEAIEQQRVDTLNHKRLEEWQARKEIYEKKLQEPPKAGPDGKIIEITIPPDILAGFIPVQPEPVVIKDSMLLELAQKRLNVVHQYFTTQLALEEHRITLSPPKKLADAENSVNGVKIGLKAIKR